MAPSRSKPVPEDSKSESSSTKEKIGTNTSNALNGKSRRVAGNATGASSLRDVVTAGTSGGAVNSSTVEPSPGIQWSTFDSDVLHGYRYDYNLSTPASFNKPYNQLVLSNSSIGRRSPTMAQRKDNRRQSKDQLAGAVRKHFNSMGIAENDVVVDFLYKVRWQDKKFRLRFAPQRPR